MLQAIVFAPISPLVVGVQPLSETVTFCANAPAGPLYKTKTAQLSRFEKQGRGEAMLPDPMGLLLSFLPAPEQRAGVQQP